jgi:hypothetical protein
MIASLLIVNDYESTPVRSHTAPCGRRASHNTNRSNIPPKMFVGHRIKKSVWESP